MLNYNLSNLIVDLCQRLLLPNITMNRNETEKLIKAAESQVKPVLYKIKVGEMILREGERVDEVKMVKLKSLQNQLEKKNIFMERTGAGIIVLLHSLCIVLHLPQTPSQSSKIPQQKHDISGTDADHLPAHGLFLCSHCRHCKHESACGYHILLYFHGTSLSSRCHDGMSVSWV